MKKFLLAIIVTFISLVQGTARLSAQDIILLRDSTRIEAFVDIFEDDFITYREAADPAGPQYKKAVSKILSVTMEDGTVKTFNVQPQMPFVPEHKEKKVKDPKAAKAPKEKKEWAPHQNFAVDVNIGLYSGMILPGLTLGLYDIADSRFGVGLGLFFVPQYEAGLFGGELTLPIRLSRRLYLAPALGVFKEGHGVAGLTAGGGLSILIGSHFRLGAQLKYFPAIFIEGTESVRLTLANSVSYQFPALQNAIPGSVVPSLCIGIAF